ncbi:MAG: decarboxylase [Nanoarchaeota archaeon]|nr:decarboxylase [Nanoarchaeota archaeon]
MQNPEFILSKSKVLEQYNKVKQAADIVSYSTKTNQIVTKILEKETECIFSVHMVSELKHINNKSRVLFLAQAWNQKLIKKLIDMKINSFVVDNEEDLNQLIKFLEENSAKINLLLRVRLKENTIRTEKYFVFGMYADVVNKRLREINANEKIRNKIQNFGIHFHRKTQNMSEWSLKYEISQILEQDTLKIINTINIGGGIPSVYANTNEDVIRTVFDKIKEFRDWLKQYSINMIIESGRFIAAPSVKLVTSVISIHENNIIVNTSVYNTDMDALIVPVKLLVQGELDKESGRAYVIKGETPCSMDLFRYRVYLNNPKVGDEIVFLNAGAYNFTTDFCDLEKIETKIVD